MTRTAFFLAALVPALAAPAVRSQVDERYLPPYPGPGNTQLGVRVTNRDTGVQLTQVLPGRPAARAGLEAGDVIITVNGHQVGYVDGQLRDVADECARRADQFGRVRLLIRNGRSGQLLNAPLQLGQGGGGGGGGSAGSIAGTLTLQGGVGIGPASQVTVRLVELPRWNAPPVTVAQETFAFPGRRSIPYNLAYAPGVVQRNRQYTVEAEVTNFGTRLYAGQAGQRYSGASLPDRIDLVLQPAGGGGQPNDGPTIVAGWYRKYLGRNPDRQGMQAWIDLLNRGTPLPEIEAMLVSSTEMYERYEDNPWKWVIGLYENVLGRRPTQAEAQHWVTRLQQFGDNRLEVSREFLSSARRQG
jgi:putative lipoprotein